MIRALELGYREFALFFFRAWRFRFFALFFLHVPHALFCFAPASAKARKKRWRSPLGIDL
jgi:hypothetical protein